jgi:hypothetical protein
VEQTRGYTAANRIGWDQIAAGRPARTAQFFLGGNSTLDDVEAELLGDVTSKSLLHG